MENPNMFNTIDQISEISSKFFFSPPAESFEKGNKRFTVADVLRLVEIKKQKAFDDTCGGVDQTAVDRNKFDTMDQKYWETNKKPKHCFKMVEMLPPRPPLPPLPCGSKLVYMGNLSPSIKESDVLEFFKDIGKVDWVKFMVDDVGFLGFGHVRFETYEAGRKALVHNGEQLLDHPVKLLAAEERTIFDTFTPSREHKYLLMGNLNPEIKEKDITEFFNDAGEVRSVRLISEDGHFLGHAHVEFASSTIAHKAVRYYGQMLLGYYVELVLATKESIWYSRTPSIKKLEDMGWVVGQEMALHWVHFVAIAHIHDTGLVEEDEDMGLIEDEDTGLVEDEDPGLVEDEDLAICRTNLAIDVVSHLCFYL